VNQQPSGTSEPIPIFPLPEVVLFPRQLLPLHVFEPRYQTMVEDALAGSRRIAVALLKPGFERHYFTRQAPIHRVMGLGLIVASEELTDGRYNILLRGTCRVVCTQEVGGRPYRRGRLRVVPSTCTADKWERQSLRDQLHEAVRDCLSHHPTFHNQCLQLLRRDPDLETLADLIAGGLPVDGELRQCLLAERDVAARTRMLLEQLRTLGAIARRNRLAVREPQWSIN